MPICKERSPSGPRIGALIGRLALAITLVSVSVVAAQDKPIYQPAGAPADSKVERAGIGTTTMPRPATCCKSWRGRTRIAPSSSRSASHTAIAKCG